jgi:hypothetical protein
MAEAICVRCGNKKSTPWEKCGRCDCDPSRDEDTLVKSVYLSVGRFREPNAKARYRTDLDRISDALEAGEQPTFQEGELARLKAEKAFVESVRPSVAWAAILRLFLPALGFLMLLFGIAYMIRMLR